MTASCADARKVIEAARNEVMEAEADACLYERSGSMKKKDHMIIH